MKSMEIKGTERNGNWKMWNEPLAHPCTHPLSCLGWEQDLGTPVWDPWRIVDWRLRPRDRQGRIAVSLQ
ncbi:hypothetical protein CsSME_00024842 [Camellia sinensis var. sinensis]